jgi:hypothetical protein
MAWVDRSGRETLLPFSPARFNTLRLAPDGRRIAVVVQSEQGGGDIWLYSVDLGGHPNPAINGHLKPGN